MGVTKVTVERLIREKEYHDEWKERCARSSGTRGVPFLVLGVLLAVACMGWFKAVFGDGRWLWLSSQSRSWERTAARSPLLNC
jgi:hypothetical protein